MGPIPPRYGRFSSFSQRRAELHLYQYLLEQNAVVPEVVIWIGVRSFAGRGQHATLQRHTERFIQVREVGAVYTVAKKSVGRRIATGKRGRQAWVQLAS